MKTKILMIAMVLSLMTIGCTKESLDNATISADDVSVNAKMDQASNDVADVVETQYLIQNPSATGRGVLDINDVLPPCANVTIVVNGTTWVRTVDFGTTGCAMPNGNILKGKIIVSGSTTFSNQSYVITYSFDNFYHNNALVQGTRTVSRSFQATTANATPHPVYEMDINMSLTFPILGTYTRVGSRTRELIEGFGTATISDNIYLITGSWTTTKPNGNSHSANITSPLRFDFVSCPAYKLVSGNLHITKNSHYADLNYGTGTCDNIYTVSIDGGTAVNHNF